MDEDIINRFFTLCKMQLQYPNEEITNALINLRPLISNYMLVNGLSIINEDGDNPISRLVIIRRSALSISGILYHQGDNYLVIQ